MSRYDEEIQAAKRAIKSQPDWLMPKKELCQNPECVAAHKKANRLREGLRELHKEIIEVMEYQEAYSNSRIIGAMDAEAVIATKITKLLEDK